MRNLLIAAAVLIPLATTAPELKRGLKHDWHHYQANPADLVEEQRAAWNALAPVAERLATRKEVDAMTQFKPGEYKTRSGDRAIVMGEHEGCLIGVLYNCVGSKWPWNWQVDGQSAMPSTTTRDDLIPPNVETWANVYSRGHGYRRSSIGDIEHSRKRVDEICGRDDRVGVLKFTHTLDGEFISVELETL